MLTVYQGFSYGFVIHTDCDNCCVPEPATLLLLSLGTGSYVLFRHRQDQEA